MSRKNEILLNSAALFRKKSYSGTSIRDIAAASGIKSASIYNHFGSKQQILAELLLDIGKKFTIGLSDIMESSLTPDKKLERLIQLHVNLTVKFPNSMALITNEWMHLEKPYRHEYLKMRDEYESQFRQVIELGISQQNFKNLDTDIIVFNILSTLRWLYSWYSKNQNVNSIELESQLSKILLSGILTK